jgi:hypothetical protein
MEQLELTWAVELGKTGVDDASDNPLARATDRLFRLGKPFLRLGKCFFLGTDGTIRWLGIFVHSAGDRLLFFPGLTTLFAHVTAYEHRQQKWKRPFQIDHLSLEPNRRTWHLTSPQSKDHLGKLATHQLDENRTFWFSMSVSLEDDLRPLLRETRVVAATPAQDTDRRAGVVQKSLEGAVFPLVKLNSSSPSVPEPGFLHFCIVAGPKGFAPVNEQIFGLPYGGPFSDLPASRAHDPTPVRIHRLELSDSIDLEVMASAHPGRLKTNVVYSCAASSNL